MITGYRVIITLGLLLLLALPAACKAASLQSPLVAEAAQMARPLQPEIATAAGVDQAPDVLPPLRFVAECYYRRGGLGIDLAVAITDRDLFFQYADSVDLQVSTIGPGPTVQKTFSGINDNALLVLSVPGSLPQAITISYFWLVEQVEQVPIRACPTSLPEADEPKTEVLYLPLIGR